MSEDRGYDDGYCAGYHQAMEDFKAKVNRVFAEMLGIEP